MQLSLSSVRILYSIPNLTECACFYDASQERQTLWSKSSAKSNQNHQNITLAIIRTHKLNTSHGELTFTLGYKPDFTPTSCAGVLPFQASFKKGAHGPDMERKVQFLYWQ